MAQFEYQYPVSSFLNGLHGLELHKEVYASAIEKTLVGVNTDVSMCTILFREALTIQEKVLLDDVVAAHDCDLEVAKNEKFVTIDERTNALFREGFEFPDKSGQIFSLSLAGQSKLHGLYVLRNNPNLVYPIKCNTLTDSGDYEITDAAGLEAFYLAAFGEARQHVDSGTSLKEQVRSATTVEEVDAVIDDRSVSEIADAKVG